MDCPPPPPARSPTWTRRPRPPVHPPVSRPWTDATPSQAHTLGHHETPQDLPDATGSEEPSETSFGHDNPRP